MAFPFLLPIMMTGADTTSRNLAPEWTEHPKVTFIADDPRAKLERVDMTPSEHARLTHSKQGKLWMLFTSSDPVCEAPCEKRLPNVDLYAVTGKGIKRSEFFVLPRGEKVTVNAKTGSSLLFGVGAGTVALGGLALIPGLGMSLDADTRAAGLATLGGSLLLLVGGTYLAYVSMTRVEMKQDERRR